MPPLRVRDALEPLDATLSAVLYRSMSLRPNSSSVSFPNLGVLKDHRAPVDSTIDCFIGTVSQMEHQSLTQSAG